MLFGNGFGFWNTMPIRRRTSTGVHLLVVEIDAVVADHPLHRAISMKSFIRLKQRSTVVLPQPDGPMNAVISCRRTCRFTSRTARNASVVDAEVTYVEHDLRDYR